MCITLFSGYIWKIKMKIFICTNINFTPLYIYICIHAHGVMVIVGGNGHGDTSSNPGRDSLHFT